MDKKCNKGKFRISREMLRREAPEVEALIFQNITIIETIKSYYEDYIEYTAYSDKYFKPIITDQKVPEYRFILHKKGAECGIEAEEINFDDNQSILEMLKDINKSLKGKD